MSLVRFALTTVAACTLIVTPFAAAVSTPRATLVSAPVITLPGNVDSNSPVIWDLEGGQERMFVLTSHSGVASIASGRELDLMVIKRGPEALRS